MHFLNANSSMFQANDKAKMAKLLRQKGQEFLASRKHSNNLLDILKHFESGADTSPCLLTVEMIFTNVLKDGTMYQEIVPLKPNDHSVENQYGEWLRNIYDECWLKILECFNHQMTKVQLQALATSMKLVAYEGKYPLESKANLEHFVPLNRLKAILTKIILKLQTSQHLINKFQEYVAYDDILFYTWKSLPAITAKSNPTDTYIMNYLMLMEKLSVCKNVDTQFLCCDDFFQYDEHVTTKCLNKIWDCVMLWEHSPATHKQLLIVLLERVLPHLEKPLLMTDFLMDSLDVGGAISLLALQGIFTMIQIHNLDYPNIFGKLYSMFEPEIFHTKFKARLFYLADMFLRSTHLPENMVAAFAKRLARLALVAPSTDVVVICMFIGNLILRHPGLKIMLNNLNGGIVSEDPFIMEERDPQKSNAMSSSLWELKTLQNHTVPTVAVAARFINLPLPSVEWDITKYLDDSYDDAFDKEIKKNHKLIAMAFDRPNGFCLAKNDITSQYWQF